MKARDLHNKIMEFKAKSHENNLVGVACKACPHKVASRWVAHMPGLSRVTENPLQGSD